MLPASCVYHATFSGCRLNAACCLYTATLCSCKVEAGSCSFSAKLCGCKLAASRVQEEVQEAAKLANAHDFILALPNGYQTMVSASWTVRAHVHFATCWNSVHLIARLM